MLLFLCLILFYEKTFGYEVTTMPSSKEQPQNTSATTNYTKTEENKKVMMERITQPFSQTQKVERTLDPSNNTSMVEATKKDGNNNNDNFRPSPQLETYYDYNKFPVKPALPEAKTFETFIEGDGHSLNSWTERPLIPWVERPQIIHGSWSEGKPPTTQETWTSLVQFPTTNDKPYKFDEKLPSYHSQNFPVRTKEFSFNKPVEVPNKKSRPSSSWFWDKLMGTRTETSRAQLPSSQGQPIQKTFYDYNILEKPPQYLSKEPEHGLSNGANPWHKIVKILTAVVPIGLLISALTPTVITVTSVNDTQSRFRTDITKIKHEDTADRLDFSPNIISKLKRSSCEDFVLCELLVTASRSKGSERHIENLLNTFTEHEDIKKKKGDLLKVFEAVKNEDCSVMHCKNIKHPT